jgi:hypothetical protein
MQNSLKGLIKHAYCAWRTAQLALREMKPANALGKAQMRIK